MVLSVVESRCDLLGCHDYAHCENDMKEMLGCYCNDGFIGDGYYCEGMILIIELLCMYTMAYKHHLTQQ